MSNYFIYLFLLFFLSNSNIEAAKQIPKAEKGILDLREWDFYEDGLIELNGEWEFYWEQLAEQKDFILQDKNRKYYINVPSAWKGNEIDGKNTGRFGFATYRLKILLNKHAPEGLSLSVKYIPTACKIFVNGKLVSKNGEIGTTNETSEPGFINKIIDFKSKSDSLEICIHVSNFKFYKSGLTNKIEMGETGKTNRSRTTLLGFELFFIGALFIMALFFVSFYFFRPIDKSNLFFGLFCLSITIYSFFIGLPHLMLFSDLPFEFQTNITKHSLYFANFFIIFFFKWAFPHEYKRWSIYVLGYTSLIFVLLTLFLHTYLSSPLMVIFRFVTVATLFYLLYIIIKAVLNKREGSKIILIGYFIIFISIINDLLYHSDLILSTDLVSVGLFIFIISLSYFLSARFARAFDKSEQIAAELKFTNENQEQIIEKRTSELLNQKEEIYSQAEQVKKINLKLIELNRFKEDLVHMIVHDLKNPLNVICTLPQILNPGDDLEMMKKAGHQMMNLVNNILDVQKYENTKMNLNKELLNLFDIVNEVIDQTKSIYGIKEIEIKNKIFRKIEVFADKEILIRIFLNLLTNAAKFTPKNGKITFNAEIENNESVKISIKDTGIGISKEMTGKIFNKYTQAATKKTGEVRATGLGLTFCKLAVESHKGEIWVESENKKGADFYFTLPVKKNLKSHPKYSPEK